MLNKIKWGRKCIYNIITNLVLLPIDDFFAEDILEEIEQTCEEIDPRLVKVYDSLRQRIEEEYYPLKVVRDALLSQVTNALCPETTDDATFNVWVNKQNRITHIKYIMIVLKNVIHCCLHRRKRTRYIIS